MLFRIRMGKVNSLFFGKTGSPNYKLSYESLLPVRCLNDWPEALFLDGSERFGEKCQKCKVLNNYSLLEETHSLYRAGLEHRLFHSLIFLLELAQIAETIKFIYAAL